MRPLLMRGLRPLVRFCGWRTTHHSGLARALLIFAIVQFGSSAASAQPAQSPPPVVGVVQVQAGQVTDTTELNGRIQSRQRVDIVARVTAFLVERTFAEGSEVKNGDLLYRLERAPFEADVEIKQAAVAQAEAQLENANVALRRAEELVERSAGTQVTLDNARAAQRTAEAQLKAAQAQLRQAQINLEYTEIRAPIDGRIGQTNVSEGQVVGPNTGPLTRIVTVDPMYVVFSVPVRRALQLRERYGDKGGLDAVQIRIRLPDGKLYSEVGKLDFVDVSVDQNTDTIVMRGTISNPFPKTAQSGSAILRPLADQEFVKVLLEGVEPIQVLTVPRAAILADREGPYVYVVNDNNVVEQRRVKLGQSTPETAAVVEGLMAGERVVVEGLQRVRPNQPVTPVPASQTIPQAQR